MSNQRHISFIAFSDYFKQLKEDSKQKQNDRIYRGIEDAIKSIGKHNL